ncbi:MAG: GNAT family N-acetyltransferase [Candidatus Staskawiczbacteria bacterium]|nr:GNAT family N-acetyltransferase [Candidatus Staskawiczbacteria bacterium]MBI3337600.1 GNAT family N-acetyltransferase [Candidatus Staskawiczbacteria bacterium]
MHATYDYREKETSVNIRPMTRNDLPEVLSVELGSFEFPWKKGYFVHCLKQQNYVNLVVKYEEEIIGFMIKSGIRLLNLAVRPDWRRREIGTKMIEELIGRLSLQKIRKRIITVKVREGNLPVQLFFRKCGFRAINVFHGCYDKTQEDAYLFYYEYKVSDFLTRITK